MNINVIKKITPWWLKILLKIILSRLPINYRHWSLLNLFRHGNPDNKLLYVDKFIKHFNITFTNKKPRDFVCLEIGPGDSIATGIVANAFGASKIYLIDIGDFAVKDIEYYKDFSDILKNNNIKTLDISKVNSFDELLIKFNIVYLKEGLSSLEKIPDSSIDFVFSHSAIEHIRLSELPKIINETKRVIKENGKFSHNIDLMDHLNYSLNSLRFSKKTWEGQLFANSGFYTNRLRYSQIIELFENSGFKIVYKDYGAWKDIPIKKTYLHKSFKDLNKEDLLIRTMHIVGKVK
jgi:ubiquinone/menaquinone biosynthesis C-methylase UbiE